MKNLYSQSVVLEPTLKTLYLYAPNPLKLHLQNSTCENIFMKADIGSIQRSQDCLFFYWNIKCNSGHDRIIIYKTVEKDTLVIDTIFAKLSDDALKSISVQFLGRCYTGKNTKCTLAKEEIKNYSIDTINYHPELNAQLLNWNISLNYTIRRYSIKQYRDGKLIFSENNIPGNVLTENWIRKMKTANHYDEFKFSDVYLDFDDCERSVEGPNILIE